MAIEDFSVEDMTLILVLEILMILQLEKTQKNM